MYHQLFVWTHLNAYMICEWIVLNGLELICSHFGIAFVSTHYIGFNYCPLTIIVLFIINYCLQRSIDYIAQSAGVVEYNVCFSAEG